MTEFDLLGELNNVSSYASGAYTASRNPAFCDIYTMIEEIVDNIERPRRLERERHLASDVGELNFTCRTYNVLKSDGIETMQDLIAKSERELGRIINLGKKSLKEIKDVLESQGLKLKQ